MCSTFPHESLESVTILQMLVNWLTIENQLTSQICKIPQAICLIKFTQKSISFLKWNNFKSLLPVRICDLRHQERQSVGWRKLKNDFLESSPKKFRIKLPVDFRESMDKINFKFQLSIRIIHAIELETFSGFFNPLDIIMNKSIEVLDLHFVCAGLIKFKIYRVMMAY